MSELKLVLTDGGRSKSKRPKQTNDCTVRALAIAVNQPYDVVYDALAKGGRKCSSGFNIDTWLWKNRDNVFGYKAIMIESYKFELIQNIAHKISKGRYLICIRDHVYAFVNNAVHDETFKHGKRSYNDYHIELIWKFVKIKRGKNGKR